MVPSYSAATSVWLKGLDDIKQETVFFCCEDLPSALTKGWNFRIALNWAMSGW